MKRVKLPGRIGCSEDGTKKLRTFQKKKSDEIGCKFSYAKIAEECDCSIDVVTNFFNNQRVSKGYAIAIANCLGLEILDIVQLDALTDNETITKLKEAFWKLNYKAQEQPFTNWVEKNHQIGAFLIQGERDRAQRWLVNRLVEQNFGEHYETDNVIPILPPTTEQKKEVYIDDVWEELGEKLKLKGKATSEKCVEKAFERWKNGSLIMTFYADNIYQEIPKIIEGFWKPLEKRASSWIDEGIESYLLMFLIDSRDRASQWGVEMVPSDNPKNWHPQKLISLPKIENFGQTPDEILLSWVKRNRTLLGCPENSLPPVEDVVKKIWDNSKGGVPELAFNEICQKCDYTWSKFEKELKYKL